MNDFREQLIGELPDMQDRLRDPRYLPSSKEMLDAFAEEDFYAFCINAENPPIYQFLNKEFISA